MIKNCLPQNIKNNIYNEYKKTGLYGDDKYSTLFQLANAFDWADMSAYIEFNKNKHDKLRHSYRASITNAIKENIVGEFNADLSEQKQNKWINEFNVMESYNSTRNHIERLEKCLLDVCFCEETNTINFTRRLGVRGERVDEYIRWKDHIKKPSDEVIVAQEQILSLLLDVKNGNKIYNESLTFATRKIWKDQVYPIMYNSIKSDCEWDFEFEFHSGFDLEDFYYVYSYLMTISLMQYNHILNCRYRKKQSKLEEMQVSILVNKNQLIEDASENTGVEVDNVKSIIELLIYDEDYHKNKITIFQPIFEVKDMLFFSTVMILFGQAQDKFLHVLSTLENYNNDISKLYRQKEPLLLDKLMPKLQNERLIIKTNGMLTDDKIRAEVDLCIYDKISNIMLLVEIKCFQKFDSENDTERMDNKLRKAIGHRIDKDGLIKSNINKFISQNFVENIDVKEVVSCILSEGYPGSVFVKDDTAIIDEYLFANLFDENCCNLALICDKIVNRKYIPKSTELSNAKMRSREWKYAGYRFIADGLFS